MKRVTIFIDGSANDRESLATAVAFCRCLDGRLSAVHPRPPDEVVASDGVFSMHGDLAPLPQMRELCDRHGSGCWHHDPQPSVYTQKRLLHHQRPITKLSQTREPRREAELQGRNIPDRKTNVPLADTA